MKTVRFVRDVILVLAMLLSFLGAIVMAKNAHAQDIAGSTNVGIPAGTFMLTDLSACPSGWTEVTTYQGYSLWAQAASGTAGATLGTGRATNTTDSSYTPAGTNAAGTFAATGANLVTTAGTVPSITVFNGTTITAGANTLSVPNQTFTGTAASTMRSTVAPSVSLRLCKRA